MNAYTFLDTPVTPQERPSSARLKPRCAWPPLPASWYRSPTSALSARAAKRAVAFLHNLVSNDVKKLAEDGAHWNSPSTAPREG